MTATETICARVEVNFELNWPSTKGTIATYNPGTWGAIYSHNTVGFSDSEADVVCREMGLSGGRHLPFNAQFNFFRPTAGPLWMKFDETNLTGCDGSETTILDCQYQFSETSFEFETGQNDMYYTQICCDGDLPAVTSVDAYADLTSCTPCAVGTYKSLNGSALCEYCPAGKYSDETGSTT